MQIWFIQGLVGQIFQFSVSKRNNHYGTVNDKCKKYIPDMNQKKETTFSIPRYKDQFWNNIV